MRDLVLILLCALLASCATEKRFRENMDSWIGASRGGLIRNMGVPDKSVVDGDTEYFVYKRFDQRYIAPTPTTYIPVDYGYGNKFTSVIPGTPGGMRTDWCDMTFTIRGDRVTAWSAKGNDCRD